MCESNRLDTANPTSNFTKEGGELHLAGATALRLEDAASSEFVRFFASDAEASPGRTLDLVARFQLLSTAPNDADTGFRIAVNDGQARAAFVGVLRDDFGTGTVHDRIGLLGQGLPSAAASWRTVPVDLTGPVTVRLRRHADGGAELVSVNGVPPDPAVVLEAAELPGPTRGVSSVEFGSFGVEAQVSVDVLEFYSEYECAADVAPPSITCTVPDGLVWYGADVTVPCVAGDGESGLASAADAAFELTTAVTPGTEVADAATDSRSVCDNAGNCATAGPYRFDVDRRAPTIECAPATFLVGQVPANVSAVATDAGSGPASQAIFATADTSSGGTRTVVLAASDAVGNAASAACAYTVGYGFSGFLAPVKDPGIVNVGKAGRTYPIKWGPHGAGGVLVTGLDAIAQIRIKTTSCSGFTNDPTDALETSTTAGTGLRYDSAENHYVYNWATPGTPGCYTLFLELDSGQTFPAFFRLT